MALHRKQRGITDTTPQFVRIPTSRASSQGVGYSVYDAHPRAQRVFAKRYTASDRSRKISSLQLRACFVLCVLLYFGAIYFADDIASIGRVVGSEQNSQNFFVHSLRPRGRGSIRVGRAVDTKKVVVTVAPTLTPTVAPDEAKQQQLEQENPLAEVSDVKTQSPEADVATAEIVEAQATEQLVQPETEAEAKHQDEQQVKHDDAPGDAIHPDDQGEESPIVQIYNAKPGGNPVENVKTISTELSEHHKDQKREQEDRNISSSPKEHVEKGRSHPTPAIRHPEADVVSAASPARDENQHILVNSVKRPKKQEHHKPSEHVRGVGEEQRLKKHVDGQQQQLAETTLPASTPVQATKSMVEHISDI